MDSTNSIVNKDFFDALIPYIYDMNIQVRGMHISFNRNKVRPHQVIYEIIIQKPNGLEFDMELARQFFDDLNLLQHPSGFTAYRGTIKDPIIGNYLYEQYRRK